MNNELCEKYLDARYGDNLELEVRIGPSDNGVFNLHRRYHHDDKTVIHFIEYPDGFNRVVSYNMTITEELIDWCGVEEYNEALDMLGQWVKTKFKYND
jgi:hypothetical protein